MGAPGLPWKEARGGWRWTPWGRALKEGLDRLRLRRVRDSLRLVHGEANPRISRDEWLVLSVIRNAKSQIRSFLEHHLDQGAAHVVLVDNGSEDETVDLAREYPRTTVFECRLPFRRYEWLIRRFLVERFACGRWSLTVDVDERFDYPFSDHLPMRSLLAYLDASGYTAVVAYLLDRFPSGPLLAARAQEGEEPEALHTHYDLSGVRRIPYSWVRASWGNRQSNAEIAWCYGGVRQAAFGIEESLTKQPLVLLDHGTLARPAHHVCRAHIADFTAVLHHLKFSADFLAHVRRVVEERSFPRDSVHYRRMLERLEEDPTTSLMSPTARGYAGVDRLVDEGFLIVSPTLREWVEQRRMGSAE